MACTLKDIDNKVVPKAQLVAKGFEYAEKDFVAADSPTCSRQALRLLIALTGQNHWELSAIDIKTAFLQGKPITRDVYVIPPKEANTSYVWKLKKCIFGLADASRNRYDRLNHFYYESVYQHQNPIHLCFITQKNEIVSGFIAIHVDYILWSGSNNFEHKIIAKLRNCVVIGKENSMPIRYLVLNLSENSVKNISIKMILFPNY